MKRPHQLLTLASFLNLVTGGLFVTTLAAAGLAVEPMVTLLATHGAPPPAESPSAIAASPAAMTPVPTLMNAIDADGDGTLDASSTGGMLSGPATHCGLKNERACTIAENVLEQCQSPLVEIPGCAGDCYGGTFLGIDTYSTGTCVEVTHCGGEGERACITFETGYECESGLTPIPGCSGDCFGKGVGSAYGKSTHSCAKVLPGGGFVPMSEPGTNALPDADMCTTGGYADMHLHLFADLAHGGGVLAGQPYDYGTGGGVNQALAQDFTTDNDLVSKTGGEIGAPAPGTCPPYLSAADCSKKAFHMAHDLFGGDQVGVGTKDGANVSSSIQVLNSNLGAPIFNGWPKWSSTTHQQAYYQWLKRAWQGGLRMTTMLAVTNEALCRSGRHLRDTNCYDSMGSIKEQLDAAKAFETWIAANDGGWFRIAYEPSEAREIITQGKLAVVLGIETAELFNCKFPIAQCELTDHFLEGIDNGFLASCTFRSDTNSRSLANDHVPECTPESIKAQVEYWYNQGVRHIFPVHNFDNAFGGAAAWMNTIEVGERIVEDHWWATRECRPAGYGLKLGGTGNALTKFLLSYLGFGDINLGPAHPEEASCNQLGLLPLGETLLKELMKKGMIIDIDHMSTLAIDKTLDMAESLKDSAGNEILPGRTMKYPVVASHVQAFDMHPQDAIYLAEPEGVRHERMRTQAQLLRIKGVGGMVAAMLKDDLQDTDNKGQAVTSTFLGTGGSAPVLNDCRHSSKSFAQQYQWLSYVMGGPVAFGSDFNGVAGHLGPRFGSDACGGWPEPTLFDPVVARKTDRERERSAQYRAQNQLGYPFTLVDPNTNLAFGTFNKQVTGKKTFNYNFDGMAHIGLLPDFVQELKNIGMPDDDMKGIFKSAEAYIQVWERAKGETFPSEDSCEFFSEPDINFTNAPATALEGDAATAIFTVRKGWTIQASCGIAPVVLAKSPAGAPGVPSWLDQYSVTCTWGGGNYGGPGQGGHPQFARFNVTAAKAATTRFKSHQLEIINKPPQLTGLAASYTIPLGTIFNQTVQISDIAGDIMSLQTIWGDGGIPTITGLTSGNVPTSNRYMQPGTYNALFMLRDEWDVTSVPFTVTVTGVEDHTPPVLTVPANVTVPPERADGSEVKWTVSALDAVWGQLGFAADNMPGNPGINCFGPFGAQGHPTGVPGELSLFFYVGTSTVTCEAIDYSGNKGTGSFTITVTEPDLSAIFVPQFASPIAHWRLDEEKGDPLLDTARAADPQHGFSFAPSTTRSTCGGVDRALQFIAAGMQSGSINVSTGANLGYTNWFGTGNFTFTMWFRATQPNGTLLKSGYTGYDPGTHMRMWIDGNGLVQFAASAGYGSANLGLSHTLKRVDDNVWHFLTLTRNNNVFTLKIDDQADTTNGVQTSTINIHLNGDRDQSYPVLRVGLDINGSTPATQVRLDGAMSDIQLFDRALSASELTTFYKGLTDANNDGKCDAVIPDVDAVATSSNGGVVFFTATAKNGVSGNAAAVTCTPASGATFPNGVTQVSCSSGKATVTFNVRMADWDGPTVHVPQNIITEAMSATGRNVPYVVTATDPQQGNVAVTCAPASGALFPIGSTEVNCTAVDQQNLAGTGKFVVTVFDGPPTVADHADVIAEATQSDGAVVTYTPPSTADLVDGAGVASCLPASGTPFPIGTTTVTCTATDSAENTASPKTFNVIVRDTQAPMITVSLSSQPNAAGWHNGAVTVTWTTSDNIGVTVSTGCATISLPQDTNGTEVKCTASDAAGNVSTKTVTVKIDQTPPEIVFGPAPPTSTFGWYNTNVNLAYQATDGGSGLAPGSAANGTVLIDTEGLDQRRAVQVTDVAGNVAEMMSPAFNIDRTPPTITGARAPLANPNGWNNTDVAVTFTCSDALAGVIACDPGSVLTAEGAGQSRTAQIVDRAGNSASATVDGISIDKTAPVVGGARLTPANGFGWNNGAVTARFTAQDGMSGINGPSVTDVTRALEGADQIADATFTDLAGNTASASVSGINIDLTPPILAGSRAPLANANGWNNTDVTVSFACSDALSGVDACSANTTVTGEGAAQSRAGQATDRAGNIASIVVGGISIDKTNPTISGAPDRTPNASNWYNAPVTISFTCADALSGVGACGQTPQLIATEGTNQSRSASVTDLAGNSASASVDGINIDLTPPIVTCSTNAPSLWPANHKMVNVTASVSVNGGLSGGSSFTLMGVTSSEPDGGLGGGDTANDIQGWTDGTADISGQLRAERSVQGSGRTYSLTYRGVDAAGNAAACTATVTVPRDQSKK